MPMLAIGVVLLLFCVLLIVALSSKRESAAPSLAEPFRKIDTALEQIEETAAQLEKAIAETEPSAVASAIADLERDGIHVTSTGIEIDDLERAGIHISSEGFIGDRPYEHRPTHTIEVRAGCPPGMGRKLARQVAVAGISRRQAFADGFVRGFKQGLVLAREPGNVFDRSAIAVIGTWVDRTTGAQCREQLGYVPRDTAAEIASKTSAEEPIAAALQAVFIPVPGRETPGLRFDIWAPKRPRKKKAI